MNHFTTNLQRAVNRYENGLSPLPPQLLDVPFSARVDFIVLSTVTERSLLDAILSGNGFRLTSDFKIQGSTFNRTD